MVLFDDSLWPLVTVKFVGSPTEEQFDSYLAKMSDYLSRGEKYVVLYDSSQMDSPTMHHRQRQVEWLQANDAKLRQWMIGTGFVINSPLLRLAMNVIYQLNKPPCPYTAAGNMQAALLWAADRFRDEGLTLPSVRIRTHFGLIGNNRAAR